MLQVKAAICENVNLYLEKNEEEFAPFLRDFATSIWGQLMQARSYCCRGSARRHRSLPSIQVGLEPSKDALATQAMRFLTTLVSGVHHTLFQARRAACLLPRHTLRV